MEFKKIDPVRKFRPCGENGVEISDCAHVSLEPNEQITIRIDDEKEYDVVRKDWGFYATSSLNGRLKNFGLRGVLVKGPTQKCFLWLVEEDKEEIFLAYLKDEKHSIVSWLDTDEAVQKLAISLTNEILCETKCICGSRNFKKIHTYTSALEGEIQFQFNQDQEYERHLLKCNQCAHILSKHKMDISKLYEGNYAGTNYGDLPGIKNTYEKIMSLAPEKSDYAGQVDYVIKAVAKYCQAEANKIKILDIGSGLCVFLGRVKMKTDWDCTAIDLDKRSIKHAQETVGVNGICANFFEVKLDEKYDVICFNKVLEHVRDPANMLAKAKDYLNPGGLAYIEVPDGEEAFLESPSREEFFIDHLCIFSMQSLAFLVEMAGFRLLTAERLREPSKKYILRAIVKLKG